MERIQLHLEEFVGKLNKELSRHPECLPGMKVIILRPELKYSYEICDPTRDPNKPGSLEERMRADRVFKEVIATDASLNDLKDALKPYLSEGLIGPYLYCKQVDMGNPYLRMIADYHNIDGSTFGTEIYVPHHYIKFIVAGSENKQIGF